MPRICQEEVSPSKPLHVAGHDFDCQNPHTCQQVAKSCDATQGALAACQAFCEVMHEGTCKAVILMDADLAHCCHAGDRANIILIHMGLHMIEGLQGIVQLYEIAIPGLEDRACILAPLSTLEKLGAG